MGRKSLGYGLVGLLDFQVLEDTFMRYESYGRLRHKCEHSVGLNLFKFQKLLQDVGLFRDKPKEIRLLFEASVGQGNRMTFDEYLRTMVDLAEQLFPQTACNETALHRFITEYLQEDLERGGNSEIASSTSSFTTQGSCGPHVLPWDKLEEYSISKRSVDEEASEVEQKLAMNFVETSLAALQKIYNYYAKHWCCAGHERSLQIKWKWRSKVCYGGFKTFLQKGQLVQRVDPDLCTEHVSNSSGNMTELGEALEHDLSEQAIKDVFYKLVDRNKGALFLNFWQFVTGISSVVGDAAKQEGKSSIMVIEKMLENCVRFSEEISKEAKGTCTKRPNDEVRAVFDQNVHFLRPIFAKYASTLLGKPRDSSKLTVLSCCNGDSQVSPVLSTRGVKTLCSDFDLIPQFTTFSQIESYMSQQHKHHSSKSEDAYVTYEQLIEFLAECSKSGLSKYPLRAEETSMVEKVQLLLKRMHCSRGFTQFLHKSKLSIKASLSEVKEHTEKQSTEAIEATPSKEENESKDDSTLRMLVADPPIPADMTPLKAVDALNYFDALKAKYNVSKEIESSAKKPVQEKAKIHQPRTTKATYHKAARSHLYKLDKAASQKTQRSRKPLPIWTGKPRTKPRKPLPRAGGRLVFNQTFSRTPPKTTSKLNNQQNEDTPSVTSSDSWCEANSRSALVGAASSVASSDSWWDTRSALSLEERIELALQRT